MKELRECLTSYGLGMLEAIAQSNGLRLGGITKEEIVSELARELLRPEAVSRMLASLSPREREALDRLLAEGGKMKAYLLVREYGGIRTFGPGGLSRAQPWLAPATATERLYFLGLLARGYGTLGDYSGEILFVPKDLLALLPAAQKRSPLFWVSTVPAPAFVREGDFSLVKDLFSLLGYLRRWRPALDREGRLPAADIRRLSQRMLVDEGSEEGGRFAFLRFLAEGSGLIEVKEGVLEVGPRAREWLHASMLERVEALWAGWRQEARWNELWQIPSLHCEPTGWQNNPLLARRQMVEHLRQCPTLQWVSLVSFVQAVKRVDPDFQRPNGDYNSWYIREAESGRYLSGFENWEHVEGALIVHIIARPLHWLGAVSLGYEQEGQERPDAFLITNLGAACLGLPHQEIVELPRRPLVVQDNLQVLAPPEADPYDCFLLEGFAELERRDMTCVYRITQDSVMRLLRRGVGVERALAFLERASQAPVPQNVARAMREWGERYGEITLHRAVLIEVREERLMEELRASSEIAPYLEEFISPTIARVKEGRWAELVELLRRLGYLPMAEVSGVRE